MGQAAGMPRVTVVVTTRDRYSAMRESITSLFENTDFPFKLVIVTGKAPGWVRKLGRAEASRRGGEYVDCPRPLTPAEARNVGIDHADTEYVVFTENDVVYSPGWLKTLVEAADATHAGVIAPMVCEGRPLHTILHHVGAVENNDETLLTTASGEKDFVEEFFLQGHTLDEVRSQLSRRRTLNVEMHCFMVRKSVLDRIGKFDPDIVSKEYLDFSWRVRESGETMWVEPESVVTFLVPSKDDPVHFSDLSCFLLRWSRSWQTRSHDALKAKWNLKEEGYIASRRSLADWRIVDHVTKPVLSQVPIVGKRWGFVHRASVPVNFCLNAASNLMAWRYDRSKSGEHDHAT